MDIHKILICKKLHFGTKHFLGVYTSHLTIKTIILISSMVRCVIDTCWKWHMKSHFPKRYVCDVFIYLNIVHNAYTCISQDYNIKYVLQYNWIWFMQYFVSTIHLCILNNCMLYFNVNVFLRGIECQKFWGGVTSRERQNVPT
jgi:hypothetical protein